MHVVFYTPHWKKGGIERVIKYIVDGMAVENSDYKFSIVTEDVPNPQEQYVLPKSVDVYFRNYTPFNPANQAAMRDLFIRLGPDVVVVMASNRALYKPSRALVGLPIPTIISEHNSSSEITKKFNGEKRFLNAVRNLGDFNHVLFEGYAEDYKSKHKVRVINNPIVPSNLTADVRTNANGRNKIVNISRYDLHQKQQDVLVKSFALIADKYPSWSLELHGGDWYGGKSKLQKLVQKLGIGERVALHDATDRVGEILAEAKVFAFPSAYEGSPLVVGEALAHGLPVVGFQECAGVNQIVVNGHNGVLVEAAVRDFKAYAKGLESIINNDDLRLSMSNNALISIGNYRLGAFIDSWRELFDEAARKRGSNALLSCSDIELDYIDLVGSGFLFDRIAKGNKAIKQMNRIEGFMKRYKLTKIADAIYKRM